MQASWDLLRIFFPLHLTHISLSKPRWSMWTPPALLAFSYLQVFAAPWAQNTSAALPTSSFPLWSVVLVMLLHPAAILSNHLPPSHLIPHDIILACTLRDRYHMVFNYFLISPLLYAIILSNKSGFLFIFEFWQLGRHSTHTVGWQVANLDFSAQYVW